MSFHRDPSVESTRSSTEKPWKCGDPYHFPLDQDLSEDNSKSKDSWNFVLEYFSTREKVRCDAWKDEVQNLLIFSGLFSAVVTAFLIESYKQLQENSGDMTVVLLSQLISIANATTSTPSLVANSRPSFTPNSSSIRVNVFWFLSLVFSLTTAVIGIVSLQWVREHQRPIQRLTPRQEASLLHMNADGLDAYYVPQIFASLPLLLLAGPLFLVGVADFLWHLNIFVAIPIVLAIAMTLAFLLISTILPGLQSLPIHRNSRPKGSTPRVPCPYKSPQSWAFLRLVAFPKHLFKTGLSRLHLFLSGPVDRNRSRRPLANNWILSKLFEQGLSLGKKLGFDWHEHGLRWLHQREIDSMIALSPDGSQLTEVIRRKIRSYQASDSQFDSLHALLSIRKNTIMDRTAAITLYKCFEDLDDSSFKAEERFHALHLNRMMQSKGVSTKTIFPVETLDECKAGKEVLLDNARLMFLEGAWLGSNLEELTAYHAEICIRLTEFLSTETVYIRFPLEPIVFICCYGAGFPAPLRKEIYKQIQLLVSRVLRNTPDPWPPEEPSRECYIPNQNIESIFGYAATLLGPDPDEARDWHKSTFASIATKLENSNGHSADYLFATTSLYVWCLLRFTNVEFEELDWIRLVLRDYKSRLDGRDEATSVKKLWERLTKSWRPHDWTFLFDFSGTWSPNAENANYSSSQLLTAGTPTTPDARPKIPERDNWLTSKPEMIVDEDGVHSTGQARSPREGFHVEPAAGETQEKSSQEIGHLTIDVHNPPSEDEPALGSGLVSIRTVRSNLPD